MKEAFKDVNIWNDMGNNFWLNRPQRQKWAIHYVLYPELYKLLNDCAYNSILDYGCGDGNLCRYLLNKNVSCLIHAYDPSPSMLTLAADNIGNEHVLSEVNGGSYDVIFLNMVLQDVDNPTGTMELLQNILTPQGNIILSIPHPAFSLIESRHLTTKREYSENGKKGVYRYLEQDKEYVYWDSTLQNRSIIYNRTIETYIKYFRNSGFVISDISEPRPLASGKIEEDLYTIHNELPGFMIFRLRKKA